MPKDRRHFTGAEKLAVLRQHLIDKVHISDLWEKQNLEPTVFYFRQKKLFEEGTVIFESKASNSRQQAGEPLCLVCRVLPGRDHPLMLLTSLTVENLEAASKTLWY